FAGAFLSSLSWFFCALAGIRHSPVTGPARAIEPPRYGPPTPGTGEEWQGPTGRARLRRPASWLETPATKAEAAAECDPITRARRRSASAARSPEMPAANPWKAWRFPGAISPPYSARKVSRGLRESGENWPRGFG